MQPLANNQFNRIAGQAARVSGALAMGAGLIAPMDAQAALLVVNIGQTVSKGELTLNVFGDDVFLRDDGGIGFLKTNYGPSSTWELSVSSPGGNLSRLSPTDTVDQNWFDGTRGFANPQGLVGIAYNGATGAWPNVGDSGFVALRRDNGAGVFNFALLELTRSSLTVGIAAVETTPGVGIPAAAVPEPGSLMMLATGALALAAMRRRQRASSDMPH